MELPIFHTDFEIHTTDFPSSLVGGRVGGRTYIIYLYLYKYNTEYV